MLHALLEAPGTIAVRETSVPQINDDSALLKVESVAVCGSDLRILNHGNPRVTLPAVMGHEAAGVVVKTGQNVTRVKEGDRVALGAVAAVSLLVGGIGIMNIMLASVTERTREIGTRLAIGALEREVLLQFLVEAVVLSSVGGLIGIGLALLAAVLMSSFLQVPFVLNIPIILVAFLFSAAIGVIFGYFPARKAARLNPIEALRYE
ncbi:MAG TPA: FtsX-like permease family protein [Candidatus Hydrogenedentes bacterium]|nr:FtsX-like permease family protein [Candidatus Hydrogenedentota bacterium]